MDNPRKVVEHSQGFSSSRIPTSQLNVVSGDDLKKTKPCDDKFHVSMSRIQFIQSLKELAELIEEDPSAFDSDDYRKWCRGDN